MRVYRTTDIVKLKIGELEVGISPLSYAQKAEIQAQILTGNVKGAIEGARLAVKYGVKSVSGLEDADGNAYELAKDESGLSDSAVDDLLNVEPGETLSLVCLNLIKGLPGTFVDPNTGQELKGVKVLSDNAEKKSRAQVKA